MINDKGLSNYLESRSVIIFYTEQEAAQRGGSTIGSVLVLEIWNDIGIDFEAYGFKSMEADGSEIE